MRSTHSQQLERWLGADNVESLSRLHRGWYGPPIALAGVPGEVYVCGDGDFVGECRAGFEASVLDRARDLSRRLSRAARLSSRRSTLHMGFASITDFLSEAAIKRQEFQFNAPNIGAGQAGSGICLAHWISSASGLIPPVGASGSAAPGGRAPTNSTAGAFPFVNPISGDTTHFVGGRLSLTAASGIGGGGGTALIYDRIFDVAKTMNSTGTESVTGVPTRYTNTTTQAADYASGNFLFMETDSGLANTAHNWTVCTYTDQDGNTGATLPTIAGIAACALSRLDMPLYNWFAPLASGDHGISALTQMQCDASVATGAISFVMGHPIGWICSPLSQLVCGVEGVLTAFNMARIFDSAALSVLTINGTAAQTAWSGGFTTVSG